MKTQTIRLIDVFILGPAMMFAGHKLSTHRHAGIGTFLIVSGTLTSIYNWTNYQKHRRTPS